MEKIKTFNVLIIDFLGLKFKGGKTFEPLRLNLFRIPTFHIFLHVQIHYHIYFKVNLNLTPIPTQPHHYFISTFKIYFQILILFTPYLTSAQVNPLFMSHLDPIYP